MYQHGIQLSTVEGLKAVDASPLVKKGRYLVGQFVLNSASTCELYISICKEDDGTQFHSYNKLCQQYIFNVSQTASVEKVI